MSQSGEEFKPLEVHYVFDNSSLTSQGNSLSEQLIAKEPSANFLSTSPGSRFPFGSITIFTVILIIFLFYIFLLPLGLCSIESGSDVGHVSVSSNCQPLNTTNWYYSNCVFFSYSALTTIGFAYSYPSTPGGRVWTVFYVLIGMCLYGTILLIVGRTIFDFSEKILLGVHQVISRVFGRATLNRRNFENRVVDFIMNPIMKAIYTAIFIIIYWLVGAGLYCAIETWNFGVSFWFIFSGLTTTGFDTVLPKTVFGKIFFIFYSFFGLLSFTLLISFIAEHLMLNTAKSLASRIQNITTYQQGQPATVGINTAAAAQIQ